MKRKGQVALILCMTVCALLLLAAPVFAQPSDIQGHWAEQTISKWVDSGYISGYPDGTFKPDNSITGGGIHHRFPGRNNETGQSDQP